MSVIGAVIAATAGTLVAAPAAQAADDPPAYPGSIPTTCESRASRDHIPAGATAYGVVRVEVGGNAYPQGRVIIVWHGNTGTNYRGVRYKSGDRVLVPAKLPRGTYSATAYYFPTRNSVYQKSSSTFTQVVQSRKAYFATH